MQLSKHSEENFFCILSVNGSKAISFCRVSNILTLGDFSCDFGAVIGFEACPSCWTLCISTSIASLECKWRVLVLWNIVHIFSGCTFIDDFCDWQNILKWSLLVFCVESKQWVTSKALSTTSRQHDGNDRHRSANPVMSSKLYYDGEYIDGEASA